MLAEDGLTGRRTTSRPRGAGCRDGGDRGATARWRDEVAAARRTARSPRAGARPRRPLPTTWPPGSWSRWRFPERVARPAAPGAYLSDGRRHGRRAGAGPACTARRGWRSPSPTGRRAARSARIRVAAVVDEATARQAAAPLLTGGDEVRGGRGRGRPPGGAARRDRAVRRAAGPPGPRARRRGGRGGLRTEGLALLRGGREAVALRERLAFCHRALGAPWPAVDDEALLDGAPEWLGPELAAPAAAPTWRASTWSPRCAGCCDWRQAARLDEMAPGADRGAERFAGPGGLLRPAAPVLAVKIQEAFGWRQRPDDRGRAGHRGAASAVAGRSARGGHQ